MHSASTVWLDGKGWLLLADPRDGRPVGWVQSGPHVHTAIDLLLYCGGQGSGGHLSGVMVRGKIPLSR